MGRDLSMLGLKLIHVSKTLETHTHTQSIRIQNMFPMLGAGLIYAGIKVDPC